MSSRPLRWRLLLALSLCLALSLPLGAQQQNALPLPTVNYAITQVATASISATTTSQNASLGAAAATVFVTNEGASPVCVALGGSGVTAAFANCPGGNTIYPGQTYTYGEGTNTYVAAVTGTGTATVAIQTGYLSIASSGGGGGGGVVTTSPNGGAAGVLAVGGNASSTPLPVIPEVSSAAGAGATHAQTSALASNLVVKASAGNLYSFEVAADSTLSAAAWWLMIFDATTLPADGAVTPAKCISFSSGTVGATYAFPNPVQFATGIVIGVSTNGCFTKAASAHAFLAGDYQ